MMKDLRFAIRMLRRTPGFSLMAVLCLTLGIGATTSVLSWIEGILVRPFPKIARQDRMVAIAGTSRSGRTDVSWPDFQDFQRNARLAEAFIAEHIFGTTLSIGDRADRATGSIVSANYFQALGIQPILGRAFESSEDTGRNAHPVTVISYQAWKDRYHGDPAIVGKTQMLNAIPHTIIGVAPEGFFGTFVGYSLQFWVPASMEEIFEAGGYKLENRGARWVEGFEILKPGVTIEQAQAEISALAQRIENDYPATNRGRGIRLYPLWQTPFNNAGTLLPTLRISMVVACFVLLIACANVGNLLLVRSFQRRHEMTVRMSLGAGRGRLLRQLLIEGLLLATLAGGGGFLVANWCRNLIMLLFPVRPGSVVNLPAEIDWRVLALSAAVCLISTVLFGLVPAMEVSKIDLAGAMKAESSGVIGGRGRAWIRSALVVVQVSLSFVLLVGAGLLIESLQGMRESDPGFSAGKVLTTSVDMVSAGYDAARMRNFQDQLVDRVQALGGVESAVWAKGTPFTFRASLTAPVVVDGYVAEPGEQTAVDYNEVGPRYLATMGIPLVEGRDFTAADDETAAPVAVVNETMARLYWNGQEAVGKKFQLKGRSMQVVGVAKNSKYCTLIEKPKPFLYVPMRQNTLGGVLQIRTAIPPQAMAGSLVREIKALDSNLASSEVITMQEQVDRMSWTQRAAVTLLGIFGGMALLLAGVGLYGVMSYAVSQSSRELGLRIALGADQGALLRLVMSRGFALTAGGLATGIAASLLLTRLMGDLLYKVSPRDPRAFAAAFAVMIIAAAVACWMPARRATRTDPVQALRS
jgi:predicted permease